MNLPQLAAGSGRFARAAACMAMIICARGAGAQAADLIIHNGFESCWSKAVSEAQFLTLMQTSIDASVACVPSISGGDSSLAYSACYQAACSNNVVGCLVTLRAGAFSGDFASGAFSGSGTADDIAIPIAISVFGVPGSCSPTVSNITLSYSASYTFQPDGDNGAYAASLDQSLVALDTYDIGGLSGACIALGTSAFLTSLTTAAEQAAADQVATLLAPSVGQSVCPVTP